jgi:predicted choloylglycine hydrolase
LDLGRARAGCRSVVVSQTNVLFHAHNLDWDTLGGLGRWTTCIVRRNPSDGRLATVCIGFPGMIGALDIINEKGLALSFNQLGWGKGGTNEPVFLMLRRIAEMCASLEAARTNLIHAAPGMPFIITVSDARSGTGSVFERVNNRVGVAVGKGSAECWRAEWFPPESRL